MARIHTVLIAVLALLFSVMVTAAPALVSPADAQIDCSAVDTKIKLEICIASYNLSSAPTTTTIDIVSDITYGSSSPIEPINSAADPSPTLVIHGNGHSLEAGSDGHALEITDGDVTASNLTLSGDGTNLDAAIQVNGGLVTIANISIDTAGFALEASGDGAVTLKNATISKSGGGVQADSDSAITIENSTISETFVGVHSFDNSVLTVRNSTIVDTLFDAVWVTGANSTVVIEQSTIVDNKDVVIRNIGGSSVTMSGSLVAGNRIGCIGPNPDAGGNAVDVGSCGSVTPNLGGTYGPLSDNPPCVTGSNCTPTIALLPGSPAIDVNTDCPAGSVDQRGFARTPGKCDAGAYEAGDCSQVTMVADEDELRFAVGCYFIAGAGAPDMTVTMTDDIKLDQSLRVHNSGFQIMATDVPKLTLDGGGHMLEPGPGVPSPGLFLESIVDLIDVTVAGFAVGVETSGHVAMSRVTLKDNEDTGLFYRLLGVLGDPTLHIENSTIANNGTSGIRFERGLDLSLIQATVVGNGSTPGAFAPGGIIQPGSQGTALVTLVGSLIAGNAGSECSGALGFTASSGNAIEDTTCGGVATPGLSGTFAMTLSPNGCIAPCTDTVALSPGSPAIDAHTGCSAGVDQRGVARTAGKCDAGAFEAGDVPSELCDGLAVTVYLSLGDLPTAGSDVILGTSGDDTINALGGDDRVCAGAGNDTVDGGDGNDIIHGEGGLDVIVGGAGDDTMSGGADRDIIRGNTGADTITGDGGNDRLLGGTGGDSISGGEGHDYLGGFGGDDILDGGPGNETIFGGFGADTIHGGPGNDFILGLIGNDTINGNGGNDTLNGDRGNDVINGNDGDDTLNGGNANDMLDGGAGDDSISGGRADDSLSGGTGLDVCVGNKHINGDTADATCETMFGIP